MDIEVETTPPEAQEDGGGDNRLLNVSVDIHDLDNRLHSAGTMLDEEQATPDEIADALLRCIQAVAGLRGSDVLVALQQRIMDWGRAS